MNGRFPVIVDGEWREAEICIASELEVKRLAYWKIPRHLTKDDPERQRIYDSVEYARMACDRWKYYHRQQFTVQSMDELKRMISAKPQAELAMVLMARPAWGTPISTLGMAYLRRTWCNHLYLEFLAAHPQVIIKQYQRIGAVGIGILQGLVALAEALEVNCIWGEATEASANWYREQLDVEKVLDHFFIEDDVMQHCRKEMLGARQEMLARRTTT